MFLRRAVSHRLGGGDVNVKTTGETLLLPNLQNISCNNVGVLIQSRTEYLLRCRLLGVRLL